MNVYHRAHGKGLILNVKEKRGGNHQLMCIFPGLSGKSKTDFFTLSDIGSTLSLKDPDRSKRKAKIKPKIQKQAENVKTGENDQTDQ